MAAAARGRVAGGRVLRAPGGDGDALPRGDEEDVARGRGRDAPGAGDGVAFVRGDDVGPVPLAGRDSFFFLELKRGRERKKNVSFFPFFFFPICCPGCEPSREIFKKNSKRGSSQRRWLNNGAEGMVVYSLAPGYAPRACFLLCFDESSPFAGEKSDSAFVPFLFFACFYRDVFPRFAPPRSLLPPPPPKTPHLRRIHRDNPREPQLLLSHAQGRGPRADPSLVSAALAELARRGVAHAGEQPQGPVARPARRTAPAAAVAVEPQQRGGSGVALARAEQARQVPLPGARRRAAAAQRRRLRRGPTA